MYTQVFNDTKDNEMITFNIAHAPAGEIKYSTLLICLEVKIKYGLYYRANLVTITRISCLSSRSGFPYPPPSSENVPGIPGLRATHKFAYLVRGPWSESSSIRLMSTIMQFHPPQQVHLFLQSSSCFNKHIDASLWSSSVVEMPKTRNTDKGTQDKFPTPSRKLTCLMVARGTNPPSRLLAMSTGSGWDFWLPPWKLWLILAQIRGINEVFENIGLLHPDEGGLFCLQLICKR